MNRYSFALLLLLIPLTSFSSSTALFSNDKLGYQVVNLETGKVVESKSANAQFIPASTIKLITGIYALETLGGDYRYKTTLHHTGEIKNGTLRGNLYLKGNGDPIVTASNFMNLVFELQQNGINKVEGSFYYDPTHLRQIKHISPSGVLAATDNAGISALSSEFNRFQLIQEDGKIEIIPPLGHIAVKKVDEEFRPGEPFSHKDEPGEHWKISTKEKYRKYHNIPVRDPAQFSAEMFRHFAKLAGLKLAAPKLLETPKDAKLVAVNESQPLVDLVELNLEYSNNLMAELILLSAVKKETGISMNLVDAGNHLREWAHKFTKNPNWKKMRLVGGSGLDPRNRLSPALLTELVAKVKDKKYGKRYFRSTLSISGMKGWLTRRLNREDTVTRVWAKTGTVDYSSGLSGFFYSKNNKPMAFTIFTTNFRARKRWKEADRKLFLELAPEVAQWKKDNRKEHDKIISKWVNSEY